MLFLEPIKILLIAFLQNVLNQLKWQCDKYINQIEKQLFSNAADNAGIIDENSNAENIIKHDFFNLKTTKQLSPTSLRKSKFFDIINNSKVNNTVCIYFQNSNCFLYTSWNHKLRVLKK